MKSVFYFLAIIFLSLLLACSEEPPTNIDLESLNKKPVPPPPTEPLVLLDNANQIVSTNGAVLVWTYGGSYTKTWEKSGGEGTYKVAGIGDVDNDGNDELIAVYEFETGRGRNKITHTQIQIFENGDTETPSRTSSDLEEIYGDLYMRLEDTNNDSQMEIVFSTMHSVVVCADDGNNVTVLWESEDLSTQDPFGVDVGDVDNDNSNEIIYPLLQGGTFGVYEYLGNNVWGNKVYSEPISFCGLDRAFVADVDADGANEVIGGGCHQKLTVWEFTNGVYSVAYESAELSGFTQGVAAGDFDNDGQNEIVVGTAHPDNSIVVVFKYNGITYTNEFQESISSAMVIDMFAGDSDNDGIDEFIVGTGEGLLVYDYNENEYYQAYSDPGGIYTVMVK